MISLLTQFGESSSGIAALGLNVQSFVIQLITFIIAYFVLRKWAFQPILKMLQERRETIDKSVSLTEELQKEKVELDAKVEATLSSARRDADGIIAEANEAARQLSSDAEAKAQKKAEGILAAADDRIKQDTSRARQKLESELVGLVSEATEAIIDEKVDATKDAQLIDRALKGAK
jgi:F-type H+-transporting ATPase subunit b